MADDLNFDDLIPAPGPQSPAAPVPPPQVPPSATPPASPAPPVVPPVSTPTLPAMPQEAGPSFGSVLGQAGMRGIREGFADLSEGYNIAGRAAVGQSGFQDRAHAAPNDHITKLLGQKVSEGWHDPQWWAAQIAHGLGKTSPSLAMGLAGGAAGTAVEPGLGTLVGGAAGFGVGGLMSTLAPAYQQARQDGLNHEAAVDRALVESGIAGVFSTAMGLAPAAPVTGRTVSGALRRPVSEALAQIFGVQPAIGAAHQATVAAVEGKPITADDLLTGYATNVGAGVGMVAGHRALSAMAPTRAAPRAEAERIEPWFGERSPVPDAPTAEPVADLRAQAGDLANPAHPRRGLWLSADNVAALSRDRPALAEVARSGVPIENFDGKGGVLIASDQGAAQWAVARRDAGVDPQVILGALTGAGEGKAPDATRVVQEVTPQGAVTRESAVAPQGVASTAERFSAEARASGTQGRGVRVVSTDQAIARREAGVAADGAPADPLPVNPGYAKQVERINQLRAERGEAALPEVVIRPEASPEAAVADILKAKTVDPSAMRKAIKWAVDNKRFDLIDALQQKATDAAATVKDFARDATAEPAPKGPAPVDILGFIRSKGGIRDETGDLKAMGGRERPGLINNRRGLSPDDMRALLVESGYLRDVPHEDVTQSGVSDLYSAIDDALRGRKIYRPEDEAAADLHNRTRTRSLADEQEANAILAQLRDWHDESGLPYGLHPADEADIVARIREGTSLDDAIEQQAMAWYDEVGRHEAEGSRPQGGGESLAGSRTGGERPAPEGVAVQEGASGRGSSAESVGPGREAPQDALDFAVATAARSARVAANTLEQHLWAEGVHPEDIARRVAAETGIPVTSDDIIVRNRYRSGRDAWDRKLHEAGLWAAGEGAWHPEAVTALGEPALRRMSPEAAAADLNGRFGLGLTAPDVAQKRSDLGYGPSQVERPTRLAAVRAALNMGRAVTVPNYVVKAGHEALRQLPQMAPEGTRVGMLARLEPVKGRGAVDTRAVFVSPNGDWFTVEGPRSFLLSARAFRTTGDDIALLRLDAGGDLGRSLGGELGHEVVHVLRAQNRIPEETWGALVRHADALRLLDSDYRTYLQSIGQSAKDMPAGVSGREIYHELYKGRNDFVDAMDQEAVAHMAELYHHGVLSDQEVAPVRRVLDQMLSGEMARHPAGRVSGDGVMAAQGRKPLDMGTQARNARRDAWRFPSGQTDAGKRFSGMAWYHGANRVDRIAEKGAFDPKRASSGPMAYFSNNPEIASNYANNKPDTSRFDDGDVAKYFTVSPRDLGNGGRTPVPVEQSWHWLTQEQKQTIRERAKRVGHENYEQADGPYVLHPHGVEATLSGSHYDWLLSHEARGNPLTALRMMWHDGGELIGSEHEMADIWRLAGYPHKISDKAAPWYEAAGVVAANLRLKNPLVTSDVDTLQRIVIPALEAAFKSDRSRRKEFGVDSWDKNTRWLPKEWVAELKGALAKDREKDAYVWTSIPDKVTNVLRGLGYDSIVDTGGKGGGDRHMVAIPFDANQVRSVNAAFDPAETNSPNLMYAAGEHSSPKRTLDPMGYYSGLQEAVHNLRQAKGTPEQMLAMLGKEGAKRGEIEATGLDKFLAGKSSVTKDEIAQFLEQNGVGINESVRWGGEKNRGNLGLAQFDNMTADDLLSALESPFTGIPTTGPNGPAKWSSYSLDPSNPTYRETVLHLPEARVEAIDARLATLNDEINKMSGNMTRSVADADMPRFQELRAEAKALSDERANLKRAAFQSGHFSEPNIVGHMMTSMTEHQGKSVYTIDQIQSDWGQKLRDGGVRDEAKVAELKERLAAAQDKLDAGMANAPKGDPLEQVPFGFDRPVPRELRSVYDLVQLLGAELHTAETAAPGHPLVNTTDQWTNTVLRRAIRQAVEAGAEYIAIPHGDTVLSYNPGDEHGMRSFYGSRTSEGIVPKNLRKLLEKIDRDSAKPVKVDRLETTQGLEGFKGDAENRRSVQPEFKSDFDSRQTGFTLFRLTDAAKRHILDRGLPVFSGGGRVEAPIPAGTPKRSVLEQALRLAGIKKNKS